MTHPTPLSDADLLCLWGQARRLALSLCAGSLQSLRRGLGGFYEEDDFLQDLFLEFWELARRWRDDQLWAAWRDRLRNGGYRVLHRRPQRLWHHRERRIDPAAMAGDPLFDPERSSGTPDIDGAVLDALAERIDPAEALELRATEEEVERLLWSLDATRRQALYLTAVADLSCFEAARSLGLASAQNVRHYVERARATMRRRRQRRDQRPEWEVQP